MYALRKKFYDCTELCCIEINSHFASLLAPCCKDIRLDIVFFIFQPFRPLCNERHNKKEKGINKFCLISCRKRKKFFTFFFAFTRCRKEGRTAILDQMNVDAIANEEKYKIDEFLTLLFDNCSVFF